MNHLDRLCGIAYFLGKQMTEDQTMRLLDDARANLGQDDLNIFTDECCGTPLYSKLREMQAEKGFY